MIVEGINCAIELLKAGYPIEKIIINKELVSKSEQVMNLARDNNVAIERVDKKDIERLTRSKNSQGVVCFVKA